MSHISLKFVFSLDYKKIKNDKFSIKKKQQRKDLTRNTANALVCELVFFFVVLFVIYFSFGQQQIFAKHVSIEYTLKGMKKKKLYSKVYNS